MTQSSSLSKLQFDFPPLPQFESLEEERLHRKQRLAAALRLFAHYGFDEGAAGHITARDPELTDHFWVNPFGMYFGHISVSDLILVNHEGKVVEGAHPVNASAFAIHSQIHAARPEIVGAAHSHSMYGKTWSALGRLLNPITQDACAFYEDHVVLDECPGTVLDLEVGRRIAQTLGKCKAIILRNHGLLTVGQSVDEAAFWFIAMERCCQAQLLAQAAGTPVLIEPEPARATREVEGTQIAGWFSFQPLYEMIVREEPDLLD